uniref:Uncharacterized protein n=1 Tax=Arundo donax TaxID=35708 RepID=A0A0A9EB98_ARUDO
MHICAYFKGEANILDYNLRIEGLLANFKHPWKILNFPSTQFKLQPMYYLYRFKRGLLFVTTMAHIIFV